jgi:hypothetical protein
LKIKPNSVPLCHFLTILSTYLNLYANFYAVSVNPFTYNSVDCLPICFPTSFYYALVYLLGYITFPSSVFTSSSFLYDLFLMIFYDELSSVDNLAISLSTSSCSMLTYLNVVEALWWPTYCWILAIYIPVSASSVIFVCLKSWDDTGTFNLLVNSFESDSFIDFSFLLKISSSSNLASYL